MTNKNLENLEVIVKAADDRLAQEIIVMDVAQLTPLADYFMVMHAKNEKDRKSVV